MTVYSFIFIVFACILLFYTITNKLDLIAITTVCFIVYAIYLVKGIGISGFYRPHLSSELYYLVYSQMFIIFIFIFLERRQSEVLSNNESNSISIKDELKTDKDTSNILSKSFYVYTTIMLLFAASNILRVGPSIFLSGKANVWSQTDILYLISLYGVFPSFAYGIHYKKTYIWLTSILISLTIFIAGSRAFTATLIIIFLLEKGREMWQKGTSNIRIYVIGAIAVVFLLIYRMIDVMIMNGDISGIINTLADPATWKVALEFNEPRVIIANYDYAITSGVRLPIGDIVYRFIDFIPGLTKIIPINLKYPEYFSTWLRAEVNGSGGVGGSIWGESYAMFGFIGVVSFTIIFMSFIRKTNKHLSFEKHYSGFIIALGTYLGWYINRLDFNRVAQATKIMFLCFIIWAVVFLIVGGKLKVFSQELYIKRRKRP